MLLYKHRTQAISREEKEKAQVTHAAGVVEALIRKV